VHPDYPKVRSPMPTAHGEIERGGWPHFAKRGLWIGVIPPRGLVSQLLALAGVSYCNTKQLACLCNLWVALQQQRVEGVLSALGFQMGEEWRGLVGYRSGEECKGRTSHLSDGGKSVVDLVSLG
jgi:hypothetical protein